MAIKFDKEPLAVEQSSYLTKIVNIYIAYDLDAWPKVPLRIFTLDKFLFRVINIVKNSDKKSIFIVAMKQHLTEKMSRVLAMTMPDFTL